MRFFFFAGLFLFVQSGLAQNIFTAKITDAISKKPLFGANVVIKGANLGSSSDISGFIEINNIPDGKQEIEFRFIGYQSKISWFTFPFNNAKTIEVTLEPAD